MATRSRAAGTVASITLALMSLTPGVSRAQGQFSADVVNIPARGNTTTKLYVGANKIRFQQLENGQLAGGAIWDAANRSMIIVIDQQHAYIGGSNSPLAAATLNSAGAPAMWQFFRPSTASDPCTAWNSIDIPIARRDTAAKPHFTCRSLGNDAVNGRPAHKWAVTSTVHGRTQSGTAWIDNRLHVVTRSQDQDGSAMELRNIAEGPQPDAVFAIPAGYHPVDMSAMIGRLNGAHMSDSAVGQLLGNAAKDIGNDAATSTADAAKQKAKDNVRKKLGGLLHLP